jgi:hypothetical protein
VSTKTDVLASLSHLEVMSPPPFRAPTPGSPARTSDNAKDAVSRPNSPHTPTPKSTNTSRTSSGRKIPRCTKCGKPRAGHPRQGCPYADTPSTSSRTASGQPRRQQAADNHESDSDNVITDAIARLRLNPKDKVSSVRVRLSPSPRRNLKSTRDSVQGTKADSPIPLGEDGRKARYRRQSAKKLEYHLTLESLGADVGNLLDDIATQDVERIGSLSEEEDDDPTDVDEPVQERTSTPVAPASSLDRAAFLAALKDLSPAPPATVYVLAASEVEQTCDDANAKGLATYIVSGTIRESSPMSTNQEHIQVVIGKDSVAVTELGKALEPDAGYQNAKDGKRRVSVGAVAAGAAVVGAVATFAGLAMM